MEEPSIVEVELMRRRLEDDHEGSDCVLAEQGVLLVERWDREECGRE